LARGVVFLGTGMVAVAALEALCEADELISLVVTQPDKPKGRGRKLSPPPVKERALELGLPVYQPENVNDPKALERISSSAPEYLVVADYGQLLKGPLLKLAPGGAINVHPSLLPTGRGPAPVAWAILSGDRETGVSTMLLDSGMDTGPVLLQESMEIPPDATAGDISGELSLLGGKLLVKTLAGLRDGSVTATPQDHEKATTSRLFDKEFQKVDWADSAVRVAAKVNALSPFPSARAFLGGKLVKLLRARPLDMSGAPGEVLDVSGEGFVVGCSEGAALILEVQPEGKRAMDAASFVRGGGVKAGDRFDTGD